MHRPLRIDRRTRTLLLSMLRILSATASPVTTTFHTHRPQLSLTFTGACVVSVAALTATGRRARCVTCFLADRELGWPLVARRSSLVSRSARRRSLRLPTLAGCVDCGTRMNHALPTLLPSPPASFDASPLLHLLAAPKPDVLDAIVLDAFRFRHDGLSPLVGAATQRAATITHARSA